MTNIRPCVFLYPKHDFRSALESKLLCRANEANIYDRIKSETTAFSFGKYFRFSEKNTFSYDDFFDIFELEYFKPCYKENVQWI